MASAFESNDQFYGKTTRIDPPIEVDGITAGLAIQYSNQPDGTGPHFVTSAIVHSISAPDGSGIRTMVLARKATAMVIVVNGFATSVPVYIDNSVELREPERFYFGSSSQCISGSDRGQKIQPGNLMQAVDDVRYWPVTEAAAKVDRHNSLDGNYQEGAAYQNNRIINIAINNIFLQSPDLTVNPNATIVFTPGSGDAFTRSSLKVFDPGPADLIDMTRVIFGTPNPDPNLYPEDASFSDVDPEYWYSPTTHRFRISTSTSLKSDALQTNYFWRDVQQSAQDGPFLIVEPDGATGYDAAGDDVIVAALRDDTDSFVYPFAIFINQSDIPSGLIEYRIIEDDSDPDKNDPVFVVEFDDSEITGIKTRETKGDPLTSQSFTAFSFAGFTNFVVIQIERSGTTVDVYANLDGGASTLIISHTFNVSLQNTTANVNNPSANNVKNGYIGVGATGSGHVRFQHPNATLVKRSTADTGVLTVEKSDNHSSVQYTQDVTLSGIGLDYVDNLTTNDQMSLNNSSNGRDHYKDNVTAGNLTFGSETSGDRVHIFLLQALQTTTGQGLIAQYPTTETTNLATDGDNDPDANRSLWRDVIKFHDPNSSCPATDGSTVNFYSHNWFDSTRTAQILQSDIYHDPSTTWTNMQAADYRWYPVDMLQFVSEAKRAEWEANNQRACFTVIGREVVVQSSADKEHLNGIDRCLDQFEDGWVTLGAPTGISFAITAFTLAKFVVPREYRCNVDTDQLEVADWMVGYRRNQVNPYNQSVPLNAWLISGDFGSVEYYVEVFEDEGFSSFPSSNGNVILSCGENGSGGEAQSGGYGTTTTPIFSGFASITPSTQYFFGSQVFQSSGNITGGDALFTFSAIGFDLNDLMRLIYDGAEILEARVEVFFSGLEYYSSSWSVIKEFENGQSGGITGGSHVFSNNNGSASWNWDSNGNIINDISSGSPELGNFTAGQGDLSFVFIGRRRDSRRTTLFGVPNWQLGLPLNVTTHNPPLANDQVVVLGGGATTPPVTLSSGVRQIVDIAGPMNNLKDARDTNLTEFAIVPVTVDPATISSLARLGSLGYAALPGSSASGDEFLQSWSGSSSAVKYDTLTLGEIYGRLRLTNGDVIPFPQNRPAIIP